MSNNITKPYVLRCLKNVIALKKQLEVVEKE